MTPSQTSDSAAPLSVNTRLEPAIIVIFGITGDLAKRYLLPSLYHLFKLGLLHDKTEIIGVSRRALHLEDIINDVEVCVSEEDKVCDPITMAKLNSRMRMQQVDMDDPESFKRLLDVMNDIETSQGLCMDRLYYLSVPPDGYGTIITNMGRAGLNASCLHGTAQCRLLVEKPFGQDYASAQQLIDTTAEVFGEEQIYRIDHYLAKETTQNILAFRTQNPLFADIWNGRHISAIDITASEQIGIEGRGDLYERQGALRDFIQNHLLQLLALVAMEPPKDESSQSLHQAKQRLLEAVQPITSDTVSQQAQRGQYSSYQEEAEAAGSHVETYADIQTTISNDRWPDTAVRLRTGKALAERFTAITLTFGNQESQNTNKLVFRIQPNEGINLNLWAKQPGFEHQLQAVAMDFSYDQHFPKLQPTAYERVLVDAIRGDRRLFADSGEILAAWRIVDEVISHWQGNGKNIINYDKGTAIEELGKQ